MASQINRREPATLGDHLDVLGHGLDFQPPLQANVEQEGYSGGRHRRAVSEIHDIESGRGNQEYRHKSSSPATVSRSQLLPSCQNTDIPGMGHAITKNSKSGLHDEQSISVQHFFSGTAFGLRENIRASDKAEVTPSRARVSRRLVNESGHNDNDFTWDISKETPPHLPTHSRTQASSSDRNSTIQVSVDLATPKVPKSARELTTSARMPRRTGFIEDSSSESENDGQGGNIPAKSPLGYVTRPEPIRSTTLSKLMRHSGGNPEKQPLPRLIHGEVSRARQSPDTLTFTHCEARSRNTGPGNGSDTLSPSTCPSTPDAVSGRSKTNTSWLGHDSGAAGTFEIIKSLPAQSFSIQAETTPASPHSKKRIRRASHSQQQSGVSTQLRSLLPSPKRVKTELSSLPTPKLNDTFGLHPQDQNQVPRNTTTKEDKSKDLELSSEVVTDEDAKLARQGIKIDNGQATCRIWGEEAHKQTLVQQHHENRRRERERQEMDNAKRQNQIRQEEEHKKSVEREHQRDHIRLHDALQTETRRSLAAEKQKTTKLVKEVAELQQRLVLSEKDKHASAVQSSPKLLAQIKAKSEIMKKQAASLQVSKKGHAGKLPFMGEDSLFVQSDPVRHVVDTIMSQPSRPSIPTHSEVAAATKAKIEQDRAEERARKRERDSANRAELQRKKDIKLAELKANQNMLRKAKVDVYPTIPQAPKTVSNITFPDTNGKRTYDTEFQSKFLNNDDEVPKNPMSDQRGERDAFPPCDSRSVNAIDQKGFTSGRFVLQYPAPTDSYRSEGILEYVSTDSSSPHVKCGKTTSESRFDAHGAPGRPTSKHENAHKRDHHDLQLGVSVGVPKEIIVSLDSRVVHHTSTPQLKQPARTSAQRIARKQKVAEAARIKKREEIIQEYKDKGLAINNTTIEDRVNAFMDKRAQNIEKRDRKRKDAEVTNNRALFIKPSEVHPNIRSERRICKGKDTVEGDLFQIHTLEKPADSLQVPLRGIRPSRQFKSAQPVKTVKDLQSQMPRAISPVVPSDDDDDSDNSEEDPDSDFEAVSQLRKLRRNGAEPSCDSGHDAELEADILASFDEVPGTENDAQDLAKDYPTHDIQDQGSSSNVYGSRSASSSQTYPSRTQSSCSSQGISFSSSDQSSSFSPILNDKNQVHVYRIFEKKLTPDRALEPSPSLVETQIDRDTANERAQSRMLRYKMQYRDTYSTSTESFTPLRCFQASVWFDGEKGDNGIQIWVERGVQSSEELAEFDGLESKGQLPEKGFVIRHTATSHFTAASGEVHLEKNSTILPGGIYTNLTLANTHACSHAIGFMKPKTPNLDHVTVFSSVVTPSLEQLCQNFNSGCISPDGEVREGLEDDPQAFTFELDLTDPENGVSWMNPITNIHVEVEEFEIRGPLN